MTVDINHFVGLIVKSLLAEENEYQLWYYDIPTSNMQRRYFVIKNVFNTFINCPSCLLNNDQDINDHYVGFETLLGAIEYFNEQVRKSKIVKPEKKKTYKRGQIFIYTNDLYVEQDLYLLVEVSRKNVCLINIENGNRWSEPIEVGYSDNIKEEEFEEIIGNVQYYEAFELVTGKLVLDENWPWSKNN